LFFIPFWTWPVSVLLLKGRMQSEVFWAASAFSALAFAVSYLPVVMAAFGMESVGEMPVALIGEVFC
jgi:hypothetical protein